MKKWAICLGLSIVFALCSIATAYDDFSTPLLDPDNWSTYEYSRTHIASGKLLSVARSTQDGERSRPWFSFVDAPSISSIKTEVIIEQISVTQNARDDAIAEARINGYFFSTVASPTDETGSVWAGVAIGDRGSGLEAYWSVEETLDDQNDIYDVLGEDTLVAPGTLTTGTVYILELEYDEPQSQFRFAIYDQTNMVLGSGQFTFSNRMGPPYNPYASIGSIAYNDVAMVSATFDNVYTKSSPSGPYTLYDDCSTYNTANWKQLQIERAVSDGKFVSVVQSTGKTETNNLMFTGNPDYIEAKISISSDSTIPADGYGHARINGYYFNDTNPPEQQTGAAGDVYAQVWLQVSGNDLIGRCYVGKSLSDDYSQWEDIWDRYFDQLDLSLDTPYTLSLEYTGVSLVFKISDGQNSQSHTYMIPDATPIYDAFGENRSLRTRAYGDGGGGITKATFDDVRTDGDVFPHIMANNSDGPIDLPSGEILSVTIELDPGIYSGYQADWWVLADAPFGWYYYDGNTETWLPGFKVSYQGPIGEVSPPLEVLNTSDLPIGSYTFYFGVDGWRNGRLDEEYLYYDSVDVNITP